MGLINRDSYFTPSRFSPVGSGVVVLVVIALWRLIAN